MKAIKLENDFPRVDGNPVASKMRAKEIAKKIVSLLSQVIVSYNLCGGKNTSISINGRDRTMQGKVKVLKENQYHSRYGFIIGENGITYYFNKKSLGEGVDMSDLHENDSIEFTIGQAKIEGSKEVANNILLLEEPVKFYSYGFSRSFDLQRMEREHLKKDSGEKEVLQKLKEILYITYGNHHDMGHNNLFPFCIVGATKILKQYVRGQYEFLMIFSHFDSNDWQQNTLKAVRAIRQRKEITERRLLVNFYILVSNARYLKQEVDRMKGGTEAAIIPFSFEEILGCEREKLKSLLLSRFDEYYFENNMLGEERPIEDDTLLFGERGKIADSIVQRCLEGSHSGIFGLRRSGKSSVLRAVTRRLDNIGIKYVKIEARSFLEGIDSWKTGLFDIAKEIRKATLGIMQEDGETRIAFCGRLKLSSTEEDYQKRASQCFVEDVNLYTRNETTFVIAIDEIELITYNSATSEMWKDLDSYKNFWGALRDSGCALIVCGVNSTINEQSSIYFNGKTCDNPMYERIHNCADFSKTYLPAFTDAQTRYMINTLGSYSNIAFNNVFAEINRAFGGQPYAIRQFCAFLFDKVKEKRSAHQVYEISRATFDALVVEFCNSEKGLQLFKTILQHITIYKEEYEMLKRIALAPEKYRTVKQSDIGLIEHIEKYVLIDYDRSTLFVTFNIQSIQDFIKKSVDKHPEDMNNDERRQYVQDRVAICEKKLKRYILNFYIYNAGASAGKTMLMKNYGTSKAYISANPAAKSVSNPNSCKLEELFNHSQFILYFSTLKRIIADHWTTLGSAIDKYGISKNKFIVCMEDLNAGRNDADHYDPEDMVCPDEWEIDDAKMSAFCTAYTTLEAFFFSCSL